VADEAVQRFQNLRRIGSQQALGILLKNLQSAFKAVGGDQRIRVGEHRIAVVVNCQQFDGESAGFRQAAGLDIALHQSA
jgi:hypothetical protein